MILRVGQILKGYCGGHFGGESYADKRIEAIGHDWVVVREEDGHLNFESTDDGSDISLLLGRYVE